MAAPLPGRCGFFVEKKKRFCKMIVARGNVFCGEHATQEEGSCRRIVCPLDPKHTVSEDKLQKHLKKCNSREKPKPAYYVENINAGAADGGEALQQVSLCDLSRTQLQSLLDRLKTAATGLQCDIEDGFLSHPVVQEELDDPRNGDSAHKHLKQQSSLLGHMEALGLLGRGRSFVEFGAGRGKLSHWIHEALRRRDALKTGEDLEDLQFLLVERSSTRFKVDGKHQEAGVQFQRLQVDIQHLDLSKGRTPGASGGPDLALRCLLDTPGPREESGPPPKRLKTSGEEDSAEPDLVPGPGPGPGPVLGVAVALCCHNRCEWRHYVGKEFFLQRGIGAEEFSAFCRMSSWATCGMRPTNRDAPSQDPANQSREEEEHEPAEERDAVSGFLSVEEREQVGRLCKQLIDAGRIHFLQERGFNSKLTRYVSSQVTLENVLLTAVP
ncbi:tRNA:m(4)X modification enzyme TRM13 homolog isoform X2 [Pseudochaenichthys georgianus]|uniref:tRNA:m(4)X modification enzyme TRM13 homolog isoform X2 n=1 Tax=Pseudochaenichthys georgianus TaxID=52239 RepID=UPI00146BE015|nr:tRNA:m(4)X modification enzyme TRM13 homolog isoform X2 [Pseudochaenichthys georgianus]